MKNIFLSLLATIGLCTGCNANNDMKDVTILEPQVFIENTKADTNAIILDVRTPDEYAEGHIEGAINLDWLNSEVFNEGEAKLDKSKNYYIYCRSGRRSNAAATKMQTDGFKVFDMKGGYLLWCELNLPVIK